MSVSAKALVVSDVFEAEYDRKVIIFGDFVDFSAVEPCEDGTKTVLGHASWPVTESLFIDARCNPGSRTGVLSKGSGVLCRVPSFLGTGVPFGEAAGREGFPFSFPCASLD